MKSNTLKKIDAFAKRHLLLSSFVCLIILSLVFNLYISIASSYSIIITFSKFIDLVVSSIIDTFFFSTIPILVISSLLLYFLEKKTSTDIPNLTYFKRLFLSFIPAMPIMLFFLIWIAQDAILRYSKPTYLYDMAILVSFVCSAIFAIYFSWLSRASKLRIIVQCIIANLLIGLLNGFMYALATWEIG